MLLAFTLGCHRQPQVAASHRQLIKSLRTAVGAKRSDWLETNAKLIDEQKAQGQLTAEEQQAFDEIVASARAGKWSEAEEQLQSLARAQVPTEEDLERLKARQVEH